MVDDTSRLLGLDRLPSWRSRMGQMVWSWRVLPAQPDPVTVWTDELRCGRPR